MGRPPLPTGKRKRASLGFRPTPELHRKLEKAAKASGLSLTQVVERRLDQSFLGDELLGGPEIAAVVRVLGPTLKAVETHTKKSWRVDKDTYYGAFTAVVSVLRALGPKDVPQPTMTFGEDTDVDVDIVFEAVRLARKLAIDEDGERK